MSELHWSVSKKEIDDTMRRDFKMAELARLMYLSGQINRPYEQGAPTYSYRLKGRIEDDIERLGRELWPEPDETRLSANEDVGAK